MTTGFATGFVALLVGVPCATGAFAAPAYPPSPPCRPTTECVQLPVSRVPTGASTGAPAVVSPGDRRPSATSTTHTAAPASTPASDGPSTTNPTGRADTRPVVADPAGPGSISLLFVVAMAGALTVLGALLTAAMTHRRSH